MKPFRSVLLLVAILGFLGSYGGKLCIYKERGANPAWVFPYSVTIFPQTDQAMLEEGIPYQNVEEFSRLMEDYLS